MGKWAILTILNVFCISILRPCFAKGASNQKKGPDGLPEIFWLIKQENIPSIKRWIAQGGDIESKGFHEATPILSAAIIDAWPIVLLFIESGADLTVFDKRGYSLAFLASRSRVNINGPYGPPLLKVREILKDKGLLNKIFHPSVMRKF